MSYILDALRRADAERDRGEVPSLHTQQYGALPGDDEGRDRPLLLIGAIVFLVLALGSALAWHFWGSADTARPAAQGAVQPAPIPPPALPVSPPMPLPAPLAASAPTSGASQPVAGATAAPTAAARHEIKRSPHAAAASVPDTRRANRSAPPAASAAASGGGLGALPDAMRRELPPLSFGGASFSKDAASRMVIFNGRVFHEGDTLAPQLVLEQIKPKSAVLSYKGYRYELPF